MLTSYTDKLPRGNHLFLDQNILFKTIKNKAEKLAWTEGFRLAVPNWKDEPVRKCVAIILDHFVFFTALKKWCQHILDFKSFDKIHFILIQN